MRWACFETYTKQVSLAMCSDAADDMKTDASENDFRSTCMDTFAQTISKKDCLKQAGKMNGKQNEKDAAESCPRF